MTDSNALSCDNLLIIERQQVVETLEIHMTRGEKRIADDLRSEFGGFSRVIINVDGERHEFNADSFIGLLEEYEGGTR